MNKSLPKILIIDGNALIHRSFHALPPTLKTKEGKLVNAVYGFTAFLLKAIEEFKPSYLVLTLDQKTPTFRHKEYAEYKATRTKAPDELYEQIPIVIEVAKALGLAIYTLAGFEADDLIGTISVKSGTSVENIIITGDLDTLQLINEHVKVYTMSRGLSDAVIYDADKVKERFGLLPSQMIDYKGLRGDPSDNLPGVKGVGEKGASALLQEYSTLEKIYETLDKHPENFKGALGDKLRAGKDNAFLSRRLATINCQAPIAFELEDTHWKGFDINKASDLFRELEFKSLLPRLLKASGQIQTEKETPTEDKFERNKRLKDYQLIDNETSFKDFLAKLKKQKIFAFDTETSGLDLFQDKLLGLSFSWEAGSAYYLSLPTVVRQGGLFSDSLHPWLAQLKPILEDAKIKKVGHNLKFDYRVMKHNGINLDGLHFDTMIASYLIAPDNRQHNLDAVSWSELGWEKINHEDLFGSNKDQYDFSTADISKLASYAAEDADCSWQLYKSLEKKIKETGLDEVLSDIEMPIITVLAAAEENGISLDVNLLDRLGKELTKDINLLTVNIQKLSGEKFNLNSPKQLQHILFEKLGLETAGLKKTKTGISTADDELNKLDSAHPIIPLLREYRELSKINQTYVQALPEMVNPFTGRVHTNFNQTIAATGRLSSTDPNLQNIPTRSTWGKRIRQAFSAAPGKSLLSLDYSQIELRLAAHMANDKKLIDAFNNHEDIHAATAAAINSVPMTDVTPTMRREAKAVNFGILYGQGPYGLSRGAGIPYAQAKDFITKYFEAYKGIKKFIDKTIAEAEKNSYVVTMFGRRRPLPDINSSMPASRHTAERMAINTPLQGTAADLIKKAMIKIYALIKDSKDIKLLLQVHDELIFEVDDNQINYFAKQIVMIMESDIKLKVPITVSAKSGKNWGDLEDLSL